MYSNPILFLAFILAIGACSAATAESCEEKPIPSSCIPFANQPGIHQIEVPGIDSFVATCDSSIAGPGWMVIQRRIDGKVDFYRDWATYREGFGTLSAEFFLGLDKIHHLTKHQRHELFIHMEGFDGKIEYAHYDRFEIASEAKEYQLIEVGKFSGNATKDKFTWHKYRLFTTFDRDNDDMPHDNCAIDCHGAWWYSYCASTNLNGKYFDFLVKDKMSIYWDDYMSLKKVQMLIRPA